MNITEFLGDTEKFILNLKPSLFIKLWFRMEDEVVKIRDLYDTWFINWDLRSVVEPELKDRITAMYKNISGVKNAMDMLGKGYIELYFSKSKDKFEHMMQNQLVKLFSDDFELEHGVMTSRGLGPMTSLCDKLKRAEPFGYSFPGQPAKPFSFTPSLQFNSFDDSFPLHNASSNSKKRSSLD